MKRKLSPPHLRPSSKLGVPDNSSREARESFLEDQHAPQAKVRFNQIYLSETTFPLGNPRFPEASADVNSKHDVRNDWLNELRNDCEMTG